MASGGKKKSGKGEKKEKKQRNAAKDAEYAAISKSRTKLKASDEYKNASKGRKAGLVAADKQRILRLRGQGFGVKGPRGSASGAGIAVVGGGGVGVLIASGGLPGHNFGAGFGPNYHHDEEEDEDENEDEDDEDETEAEEEEDENEAFRRALSRLLNYFPGVDPLLVLLQVRQFFGLPLPTLPPQ